MTDGAAAAERPESVADGASELSELDRAMHRYADGDDAAFGEIFSGLAPRLRLFLQRMGGHPTLAEDLMQETFLRIHQARGSFARGKQVAPWAYAIARNCFISHTRSAKAKLAKASVDVDQLELPSTSSASVEEESIARQTAQVVTSVLASLTPARREAFILLRYEGLSVAAAAQIVGISEGALKIRAFHAYEALRAALAEPDASAPASAASTGNREAPGA